MHGNVPQLNLCPRWQDWLRTSKTFGHVEPDQHIQFDSYPPHTLVGIRLDRYLAIRFRYFTRPEWKLAVNNGKICINGKVEKKHTYKIQLSDHVTFAGEQVHEPPVPLTTNILYEDDTLLALEKTAHIPVHEAGPYLKNTLLQIARRARPEFREHLRFCHRLDIETSGVILLTKDVNFHRALAAQFEDGRIRKTYYCAVFGKPKQIEWVSSEPLGPMIGSKIGVKVWANPNGVSASTQFRLLASTVDEKFSLLEAKPLTGRTNQIRAHAAISGFPLVGDKNYYPDESVFQTFFDEGYTPRVHEKLLFHRCLLHAGKIEFQHPKLDTPIKITCPVPADFKLCIQNLGFPESANELLT